MSCFIKFRQVLQFCRNSSSKVAMSKLSKTIGRSTNKSSVLCKCSGTFKKIEVLPTPVKSESDKKDYKVIQLENGLRACLIADKCPIIAEEVFSSDTSESEDNSDEQESEEASGESMESSGESEEEGDTPHKARAVEQKMAATALCVGVGSFSDPKEVPGMAHFLEHMVFMGSEKFPEENDFDAFIKKGGGTDNASTDAETTSFYFECLEASLFEALDKFSQFFISPLMKRDSMAREKEAIESEFQIAIPSDASRKEQLLYSLAKVDSPVNSFAWGNLVTLRDNISDDDLYKGVHEFRKRHYSAHRMTVAIQARLPMDVLQNYVIECFSKVPNNNLPPDDFSKFSDRVFDTPEFHNLYYVKPTTDSCQVELTWALPSLRDKYKSKPHQYISYLMGDEGQGSLLSYLRKRVWALGTSIGNGESGSEHNCMYAFFTVAMTLTNEGFIHLYEVIEVVFSYINMLKNIGPQQRIFDEIKTIADTSFRFSTEDSAVDLVEDLCESMQFYPPEDYIAGSELYYEYDPQSITEVLNYLTPEKMNILVLSKKLPEGIKYDAVEKWFGTEYTRRDIPNDWIKRWQSVKPYPELALPPPNPYLTNDFSILPQQDDNPEYPQKIINTDLLELWYRQDQKFKLPLAYYNFYLISPMAVESAKSTCMLDTLVNLLVIDITEELYPASSADLSYSFTSFERGLVIRVSGYNEKLPVLIEVIATYLTLLGDHITEDMFCAVKEKIVKHYYNRLLKPSSLAKDVRLNLLVSNHWTPAEKYCAMLDITVEDIKKYVRDYIKHLYIKVLVQGNVTQEIACATVNKFVDSLKCKALPESSYPKFRVVQVPTGEKCCRIQSFNNMDANSIITNYYQTGPFLFRNSVIIEIIMLIIEEPLYDILRTKEQLGYNVYCSIRDTFGIIGYAITVNAQATKYTTQYVDQRIEEFIKHTHELLAKIDEEELNQIKSDLIKMKRCVDVELKEELDRNWSEIIGDDYIFDRLQKEIDVIHEINLDELKKWWVDHNLGGNEEHFRKLTIQVVGYDIKEKNRSQEAQSDAICSNKVKISFMGTDKDCEKEKKPQDYFVQNIQMFKENLFLYPAGKTQ